MIDWLQNWYEKQCNSDWEHDYGIKIETLDNPGWSITVDLTDTKVRIDSIEWKLIEISDKNWVGFKIEDNIFSASGDPQKLNLLIYIFRAFATGKQLSDLDIKNRML